MNMGTVGVRVFRNEPYEFVVGGRRVPVVRCGQGSRPQGLRPLPQHCAHTGQAWSGSLALRCRRCGAPLFLPPARLARRGLATLLRMEALWAAAGWPEWGEDGWRVGLNWYLTPCALFDDLGGIPVRGDRQAVFAAASRAAASLNGAA